MELLSVRTSTRGCAAIKQLRAILLNDMKLVCKTSRQNELARSVLQCVGLKLTDKVKVEGARWRMVC